MARETGLEPATSGVTGRRSNQLSYSPACAPPRRPRRDPPDRIGAGPGQAPREASRAAARPGRKRGTPPAIAACPAWGMIPKSCAPFSIFRHRIYPMSHEGMLQLFDFEMRPIDQMSPFDRGALWWAVTGSNRRPSRCKRDALPAELTARDRSFLWRQDVAPGCGARGKKVWSHTGFAASMPLQALRRTSRSRLSRAPQVRGPAGRRAGWRDRARRSSRCFGSIETSDLRPPPHRRR
jgi:hypothetical protein